MKRRNARAPPATARPVHGARERSVVHWHHEPSVLGLGSASAAAFHVGATPPTRLPHVMFQIRPSTRITVRMRNTHPRRNERLVGKAWERGYASSVLHIQYLGRPRKSSFSR